MYVFNFFSFKAVRRDDAPFQTNFVPMATL